MKTKQTTKSKKVNKTQAVELIKSTKGRFFTVTFVKKNGEQRTINGNVKANAANTLGYINVYSPSIKGYRNINTQTIKAVSFNKVNYIVK